jgi:hypothetical protein
VTDRTINLTPSEMGRLNVVCRALGTSYSDFVTFAVRQALDEAEGLAKEQEAIHAFYSQ